ncbi:putative transcriptional regulator [Nocardia nova SH22a]|uniref:Putative transcriptional regulator n=1 Tax=Nocardia nova SH22a TaxID=1415166 RepID=W5TRX4_9NOCA|nr:MerR family transcriptional regulator [Nocardia nova]AHH21688.1 putative transcriptional regulator [Nocardia nova SH22a]
MPNSDLTTIGAFARASGLTASALRFYADSGLLIPALVDPDSGYRYYADDQLARAVAIRELREIGMPLDTIAQVLDADADTAALLVDDHVADIEQRAHRARERAAGIKVALGDRDARMLATVSGPVFATAVEQILAATGSDPGHPVLGGVRLEISAEALTLTATDRYRLSTRTLVPDLPGADWAATVDGADLRQAVPEIRRHHRIGLAAGPRSLLLRSGTTPVRTCRILSDPFPDHRLLLDSLATPRTRLVTPQEALIRALESQREHHVLLSVSPGGVTLSATPLPANVTGPDVTLAFDLTTLYPAVVTAIGPDAMIDIAGPDEPVVIRSADDGDLTTLAMPVAIPTREDSR